jgi:hypothetical protein
MSIQKALVGGMLGICILATAFTGSIGVLGISQSVRQEAQKRVNHDLSIIGSHYRQRVRSLANLVQQAGKNVDITANNLQERLQNIKQELGLTVLNICDVNGLPVAGNFREGEATVPIQSDVLLRRALEGRNVWGTVLLDHERLELEGGPALRNAMMVPETECVKRQAAKSALFSWAASPLRDATGRVEGLIYGGRA